ncbi:ribosomal maturation YjgA family protein [Pedobacter sp.]
MEKKENRFRFEKKSFFIALAIFVIEVLIALYISDKFVRPYVGDVLVVILIYYFVKAFVKISTWPLAIGTLLFSYLIETLQYFQFVKLIGLGDHKLANIVIGNYFAWEDLLAYTIGIIIVVIIERRNILSDQLT